MIDRWYLLCTKTNSEELAQEQLERQGYESYFPRFTRRARRFGYYQTIVGPLFPRYVFLRLLLGVQSIGPVKSTKGVMGIVRFGEDYATVPRQIITQLKARANESGLYEIDDSLTPQCRVRVKDGPFEGLEAVFMRRCGEDRVLVLMNILGQDRPLQLPEYSVVQCRV